MSYSFVSQFVLLANTPTHFQRNNTKSKSEQYTYEHHQINANGADIIHNTHATHIWHRAGMHVTVLLPTKSYYNTFKYRFRAHRKRSERLFIVFFGLHTDTLALFRLLFFLLHFANAGMCHCVLSVHAYSGLFVIPSIHSPVCVFVPINKLCVRSLVCLCTANTYAIVATQKNS